MKTNESLWRPALLAGALLLGGWLTSMPASAADAAAAPKPAAQTAAPVAAPSPFVPPQSTFVSNSREPGFGRDPFFPNSNRNAQWGPPPTRKEGKPEVKPQTTGATNPPPPPPPPQPPKRQVGLELSGIGGSRTAVINNVTFIKGEVGVLRVADGPVKIRLDDILADSIKVTIWLDDDKPEQREIPLGGK